MPAIISFDAFNSFSHDCFCNDHGRIFIVKDCFESMNQVIDAVSIATPSHLHFQMGMDCLRAGVHVLMEKPIATKISDADKLIKIAKERQIKLAVMLQYRTYRASQILKKVIESGYLGKIQRVLWTWNEFRPDGYFKRDQWRTTWQHAGGGITLFQNIHDLDLICWLSYSSCKVLSNGCYN